MTNRDERISMYDRLSPHVGDWFAVWWYPEHAQAAAIGHPWRRIRYGAGLLSALNAAGRPYRFTMRRKIRKAYAP